LRLSKPPDQLSRLILNNIETKNFTMKKMWKMFLERAFFLLKLDPLAEAGS
jgi:hypothetical protein